ncbi:fungal-specific transcription factor domain-containing protein [Colletotrichum godetiae]|uniref:Fungal-specific transcription factor domain-containing protein n=1 Tax=Colletotrichum godetiae TaxID=1209918 RepID=A0AAJ0ARB1_9PEZI|nr:fungal-specific transcription factor domain-containing protein [Colletotrichum godetiae]KAK1688938.1 fungal-specific transcription factor domain-containing protein [Colletotrichum godetiae]
MKVKCSGSSPCTRCDRKKHRCIFAVEDKRISVPESYLRELQNRNSEHDADRSARALSRGDDVEESRYADADAYATPHHTSLSQGEDNTGQLETPSHAHAAKCVDSPQPVGPPASEPDTEVGDAPSNQGGHGDFGPGFRQNPLVDNDYTFAKVGERYLLNEQGYMGPTSSWSFCRRVLALLGKRLPEAAPDPWHLPHEGAFRMQWTPLGTTETPDVSNLPPLDYALFLFNTVKFYLGAVFYVIDEPSFLKNLHELYEDPAGKASSARLWYAQYLLVLAFGKAFVVNSSSHAAPPGVQYAARAMSLLPDLSGLNPDTIPAIQALALAALYFQCLDMRLAAYQHIGQALRIGIVEGIYRHMPEEVVGIEYSRRCNIVFWVVYTLDREFSALMGAPTSIRDEDITVKLPSQMDNSLDALNMTLHVRLSRLMARILTRKEFDGSLVPNTQSILRDLARLSRDLTALLDTHFQGSVSRASRMALRLILSYHHVNTALNPRIAILLTREVRRPDNSTPSHTVSLTPPVASLLQSCVDSAQTVLRTLRVLGDEDLLEAFLPFQLEDAFSSAFLLYLIRVISPSLLHDDSWCENIKCVLDKMISKGSLVAPLRKLELSQLEHIMSALTPVGEEPPTPPPTSAAHHQSQNHHGHGHGHEHGSFLDQMEEAGWDIFDTSGMGGLSPQALLDLAERLDVEDLIQSVDGDGDRS